MSLDPQSALPEATPFVQLLFRRLSRRDVLRSGLALAAGAVTAPLTSPLGGTLRLPTAGAAPAVTGQELGFATVGPTTGDEVVVPAGYTATVLLRWGDPLRPGLPGFDVGSQTAEGQRQRFGFNCDFIAFFPLPARSRRARRGLLWVNHEYSEELRMFADWSPATATDEQVAIALAAHGGSVVEIVRDAHGGWSYVADSRFNRRITATTPMRLTGPAAGSELLRTGDDPSGRRVLGTLNNCGGGVTPWGTVLTAEENFDQYFTHPEALPDGPVKRAHLAYWRTSEDRGWQRFHPRFDLAREPHEPFRFGWVVEVDPYDPGAVPKKRTALGRLKHEGAATVVSRDGRAIVYTGDDEVFQHVYKFVSRAKVAGRDAEANRDLLDRGTLYAARFFEDGTGVWLPLVFGTGALVAPAFTSQADVLVRTREAASALGATPMDRPEDIETSPMDGRVYLAMTNNSNRTTANNDAANPRGPNPLGHVIELIEDGGDAGATSFRWEIFLLCGRPANLVTDLAGVDFDTAGSEISYFTGYGDASAISPIAAPDNFVFDSAGHLWIATDGQPSSNRLRTNDALHAVATTGPERGRVRQFLSAVKGAEVTGPCFGPGEESLFVSIQHPGENGTLAAPESHWPDGPPHPARASVVVVTKDDGGVIGT